MRSAPWEAAVRRTGYRSLAWRQRRAQWYADHGRACRVCGTVRNIELHHLRYSVFGLEPDCDLVALCRRHHRLVHRHHRALSGRSLADVTRATIRRRRWWWRLWRPVPPCPWETGS